MKFLAACANGSGTSLMMMRSAQKALEKSGFKNVQGNHCSVSEAKGTAKNYDVVFTSVAFNNMFEDARKAGAIVLPIKNPMSIPEIVKAIDEADLKSKFK